MTTLSASRERLAERLRTLRAARSMSVAEVARRARISRNYYYRLEGVGRPANPSVDVLNRVADALGTGTLELLAGEAAPRRSGLEELLASRKISEGEALALRRLAEFVREDASADEWLVLHQVLRPMLPRKTRTNPIATRSGADQESAG